MSECDERVRVVPEGGLVEAVNSMETRSERAEHCHVGVMSTASLHHAIVTRSAPGVVIVVKGEHMCGVVQVTMLTCGIDQWFLNLQPNLTCHITLLMIY